MFIGELFPVAHNSTTISVASDYVRSVAFDYVFYVAADILFVI